MAGTLPGFHGYDVNGLKQINLLDESNSNYQIRVIRTYKQLHQEIANAIENEPRFRAIEDEKRSKSNARKNTIEDYELNYEKYYDLIRDLIQKNGYGVYRTNTDGTQASEKIPLDELAATITSSFVGFDCLEDARKDPLITDIYVNSYKDIFVERNGQNIPYGKHFESERDLKNFIDRLLREDNKQLDTGGHKIVDAEVYGIRANFIHDSISSKGYTVTFRKHALNPITLDQMIAQGVLSGEMADLLRLMVRGAVNACVAGITGSGKTTLLKAILESSLGDGTPEGYQDPELSRVITVEDTPELFLRVPNCVALHTFHTPSAETSITLRDLNISALRMKPHYIIVGEIRGMEATSFIEAASTGHSSFTTIHANNVWDGINRFVDKYGLSMQNMSAKAVERILGSAMNFFIVIDNIPHVGRRITAIHEIGYDYTRDSITVKKIVEFDIRKGFLWKNTIGENAINTMVRRGVNIEDIDRMNATIQSLIVE